MEIIEIITEQVLVFEGGETVLLLDSGEVEILDVAEQGPPGIAGTEVSEIDCGTFN